MKARTSRRVAPTPTHEGIMMKRRQALCGHAQFLLASPPYHWGLSCFGQRGVSRVLELLRVELAVDMGLAGVAKIPDIDLPGLHLPDSSMRRFTGS